VSDTTCFHFSHALALGVVAAGRRAGVNVGWREVDVPPYLLVVEVAEIEPDGVAGKQVECRNVSVDEAAEAVVGVVAERNAVGDGYRRLRNQRTTLPLAGFAPRRIASDIEPIATLGVPIPASVPVGGR
jgi:hypothetical protein